MRVYLAGPLFTLAERRFMADLRDRVASLPGVSALWPGDLFVDDDLPGMGAAAKTHIFRGCVEGLTGCDMVAAVLDGAQVDDGTAWEVGYAHARGMPAWGLRTDFRLAGESAHSLVNCMIECSLEKTFSDVDMLLSSLAAAATAEGRRRG